MEIVNTEDMRKMDAEAIHEYGIPGIILMEHAAMAVMDYIREHVAKDSRIMILCGSGKYGGDGLPCTSHGGGGLFTCPYPLQCSL